MQILFGYVVANVDTLTEEEKNKYRACYCGLCKSLGKRHGLISRITLTYDMTFLILVLSAIYNKDYETTTQRCIIHPVKPHDFCKNDITDYAADMNVALAYHKFLDDWKDDKSGLSLFEAKLFEHEYKKIAVNYPAQCEFLSERLAELTKIEKSGELNPDIPANCFGRLMGEMFIYKNDEFTEPLREFGKALGKVIYIMDACLDLKDDIKKERYNPLITAQSGDFKNILNILMADCVEKYKLLNVNQDVKLIENILYSGIWTRYELKSRKAKETKKDDDRPI